MTREPPLYAIVGPTAAGKTRAAFELARMIKGEIISVDSRQVYRYLDVGTDKISREKRSTVPHHLIDVADPDEIFTAADFVQRALSAARRIESRGRVPILAGGTPMYFKALEGGLLSESLPRDERLRRELERTAEIEGVRSLHGELSAADPESAARIHPNDRVRIVRALEIFKLSGRSATELYAAQKKIGGERGIAYFGVMSPRESLFERIERRAGEQFRSGYPEEVRWLLDNGYSRDLPALRGFGYRELVDYADGKITLDEALAGDVRSTKAFSRRQMTWFRQFSPILWYDFSETTLEKVAEDMAEKMGRPRVR
ncbi:MAG: tRNA (adenosine(37)-N6)-dimethylallyltransferase MiaA [Synergistaceae bacterium]|jgi:tRNA dimethylallyltransferase|nr:tRNA (adenosine(37)-N6)-dimethylallyltransferase MiaA [Synergistaceae bacterium]